jgi:hypothetical protein
VLVTERFTAEVPLPPIECSPNGRFHWGAKSRAVKDYRFSCRVLYMNAKRKWKTLERAVVVIEYRVHRGAEGYHPKDEDNARAACKVLIDALKDAGLIRSDAKDSLRWGDFRLLTTERDVKRTGKPAGITVTVEAA